jgi:hypothetical protein
MLPLGAYTKVGLAPLRFDFRKLWRPHFLPGLLPKALSSFNNIYFQPIHTLKSLFSTFLTMSDFKFIPKAAVLQGSLWDRLPYDVIFIIMKFFLINYPWCRPGMVIDKKRFDIFNRMRLVSQLRFLMSDSGSISLLEHFYGHHNFFFTTITMAYGRQATTAAPLLPPLAARPLLRRIQIHIAIENQQFSRGPGGYMYHAVDNAADFVKLFPAARTLRNLTNAGEGFSNLDRLAIHLDMNCTDDASALALFEEAQFAVRARVVVVTATDRKDHMVLPEERPYLEELVDMIAVEH